VYLILYYIVYADMHSCTGEQVQMSGEQVDTSKHGGAGGGGGVSEKQNVVGGRGGEGGRGKWEG
jgi:hypothetical protein